MNPESGFHFDSAVRNLSEDATARNPQQRVESQDSTTRNPQPRDHIRLKLPLRSLKQQHWFGSYAGKWEFTEIREMPNFCTNEGAGLSNR